MRTTALALTVACLALALPGCDDSSTPAKTKPAAASEQQRAERIVSRTKHAGAVDSVGCRRWSVKPHTWNCTLVLASGRSQQCGITLQRGKHQFVICSSAKTEQ